MSDEEKIEITKEIKKCSKEQLIEMYVDELEESFTLSDLWCKSQEENKRLNNIINEFDKFLFGELQIYGGGGTVQEYYDKLQELKGNTNEKD